MLQLTRVITALTVAVVLSAYDRVTFDNAKRYEADPLVERIDGLLSKPPGGGPHPAVVILHTCGGVTRATEEDWPNYLTGLGYVVLTVDSFGSRGGGKCPDATGGGRRDKDAYGARDYLAGMPLVDGDRIAVMGFSLGASVINDLATKEPRQNGREFQAAIAVYGQCDFMLGMDPPPWPLVEIFGEKDSYAGTCGILEVESQVAHYKLPGAYHAFDSEGSDGRGDHAGDLMIYSWSATAKAREIVKQFLAKHLKK